MGYQSGRYIADGSTANATGNNSVFIGYDTRANADGETNQIVIGASAIGAGSNSVVLGNNNITKTLLKGNVGIGVISPDSAKLQISTGAVHEIWLGNTSTYSYVDAGGSWVTSSDSTVKKNITNINSIINKTAIAQKILNTNLYRYEFRKEAYGWEDVSTMPDSVMGDSTMVINQDKLNQLAINEVAISKSEAQYFGFLAQEFGNIWKGDPDNKEIDWQLVSVIEWYAIQELIKEVAAVKQKQNDFETRLQALEQ